MSKPKIAFVTEWLTTKAGSELVLANMISCFPGSDVYCLVNFLPPNSLGNCQIYTSNLQKLPFIKRYLRTLLPLFPYYIESFDLSKYDIIISSDHCVANGVIVHPNQLHISYVHSPMRYAWDMIHDYLKNSRFKIIKQFFLRKLRLWDFQTSASVDKFIANSDFIARRIEKCYRRKAQVLYPSIDIPNHPPKTQKQNFYLTVSRLVEYKKTELLVRAFNNMPDKKLVVIGDGPEIKKIKKIAKSNITILGYQEKKTIEDYMARAQAFVYAAQEDFGLVMVESLAQGTPVIAYGKGGAAEILTPNTGITFAEQTIVSFTEALQNFENNRKTFTPLACYKRAKIFNTKQFVQKFHKIVIQEWQKFSSSLK